MNTLSFTDVKIKLADETETANQNNQLNADPDSPLEILEHMESDSFFKYFLNRH